MVSSRRVWQYKFQHIGVNADLKVGNRAYTVSSGVFNVKVRSENLAVPIRPGRGSADRAHRNVNSVRVGGLGNPDCPVVHNLVVDYSCGENDGVVGQGRSGRRRGIRTGPAAGP
jgi:hypothetical protein